MPVPGPTSTKGAIWTFALTYDGYTRYGGFQALAAIGSEALAAWGREGRLPDELSTARAALFFEQRRWRHSGTSPNAETIDYLRALLRRIADLAGGEVSAESPRL